MENKIIVCRHGPAANGVTVTWAISQHHWVGARFEGKIYQICHCEEGKSGPTSAYGTLAMTYSAVQQPTDVGRGHDPALLRCAAKR